MDSNWSGGRVTSSTGDVDLDGALVGRVRENGTSSEVPRYAERPGLDDRIVANGGSVVALRRMLGLEVTR